MVEYEIGSTNWTDQVPRIKCWREQKEKNNFWVRIPDYLSHSHSTAQTLNFVTKFCVENLFKNKLPDRALLSYFLNCFHFTFPPSVSFDSAFLEHFQWLKLISEQLTTITIVHKKKVKFCKQNFDVKQSLRYNEDGIHRNKQIIENSFEDSLFPDEQLLHSTHTLLLAVCVRNIPRQFHWIGNMCWQYS